MTLQEDIPEMREKEIDENWKKCRSCKEYVHIDDGGLVHLCGFYFCDDYCVEDWFEELELKAEAFETIRKELGINKNQPVSKVIEEVVNMSQELTMRKEGFK